MDFADMLLLRFDNEAEIKKTNNALICFSTLDTGKTMSKLAIHTIRSKSEKAAVTLLYFIDKEKEMRFSEERDEYQHKIITDLIPPAEKDKVTVRLFTQPANDCQADILRISEEQKSNLILFGINRNEYSPELAKKYGALKNDPSNSETSILDQFQPSEAATLKEISALFNRNTATTALFIDNGVTEFRKLFVPILQKNDIYVFSYLYRIAQQDNMKIMVWDAIGIFQSTPQMQKIFQLIVKKTDGRIYLWNNDKKIECDFIKEQDLVITGIDGWSKLICTPLPWIDCLPSTLIIKEKTNSM